MRKYVYMLMLLALPLLGVAAQEATPTPTADDCAVPDSVTEPANFHIGRGDAFFTKRDYAHATEAYTCAIDAAPDYLPGYVNRGYTYAVQLNDPLALADYEHALEIDPDSVAALNNRGMLYLGQGRFQQSIDDFDRVITLAPDNEVGYHNRAVVHASEGDYDLALEDIEMSLSLNPDFAEAYATRGAIYLALAAGDYAQYKDLKGLEANRQTGNARTMLTAITGDLETEGFASWLPLLTPLREATP